MKEYALLAHDQEIIIEGSRSKYAFFFKKNQNIPKDHSFGSSLVLT
jgi:hypothetical protein